MLLSLLVLFLSATSARQVAIPQAYSVHSFDFFSQYYYDYFFPLLLTGHCLGWLSRSSWIGSSLGLCSVEDLRRELTTQLCPTQNSLALATEVKTPKLHESWFQKYLNNLIWLTGYLSTLLLPIKRLHIRPGDFFFFATDAHLSVETGHKISAAPARQSSPLLAWIVPENDLIGQWLLISALEALTGKTCASASSRELARAADMGNLCQKSLGSAGRVSFFSTSLMTHLWTDLAVIYSCHSRLHFIDLAFLHAL